MAAGDRIDATDRARDVPGTPEAMRGRLVERARIEWRRADGGDPHVAVEDFLLANGIDVRNLTRVVATGEAVGAAVLLGAAAVGPDAARAYAGAASPCPGVPDAVAVVYGSVDKHRADKHRADEPQAEERAPDDVSGAEVGEWERSWTAAEHRAAVVAVQDAIARGDVYQVNVVGHRSSRFNGSAASVARVVTSRPDTPYAGTISGEGWLVAAASPEGFVEVRDGVVRTRPIKGTARRGLTPRADEEARDGLLRSAKDHAEHVMIVDLERNDLARVAAEPVRVPSLYDVAPLAGLWHAVSVVEARLRPGVGLCELLGATFPGGSVTGAPKLAALQHIAALEPVGRGPSMGALGWVGADGRVDLALTIRTVAVSDGRVHLWTGGGVTWGSDPDAEVAEAEAKADPVLAALQSVSSGSG